MLLIVSCSTHFHSEGEKQNHEVLVHASTKKTNEFFAIVFAESYNFVPLSDNAKIINVFCNCFQVQIILQEIFPHGSRS